MSKFWISVLLLLVVTKVTSQQPVFQWAKAFSEHNTYNPSVYSNGRSVAVDGQGNVYSAGLFNYTTDFDPGPGVFDLTANNWANTGIYISKLDADGKFLWAIQIPALVEFGNIDIRLDKDGSVYLGSELRDPTDFDPGPGEYILSPIGAWDAFVAKYDANGKLVWVKQFGGPGDTVPRTDFLEIDNDNNVIVCGNFNNTVDFDPGPAVYNLTSTAHIQSFIAKLNSHGDFMWAKQFGNSSVIYSGCNISDVKCDPQGNIYTVGNFAGLCDFDPDAGNYPLQSAGMNDGYVAKLNANGQLVWAKRIGNSTNNYDHFSQSRGIALDRDNNVYTTGNFLGTFDFDPGAGEYTVTSNAYDWYVVKLTAQGAFAWADVFGSSDNDLGADIAVDNAGDVYVTGKVGQGADLDPGPGVFTATSQGEYGAGAFVRLNASGSLLYGGLIDGVGSALLACMVVDQLQNIYITGYMYGSVDFDPGPASGMLDGGNTQAPFVVKYAKCKNITQSTLSISTCDSYTLNNEIFDSAGTYIRTLINSQGCDSIITLNLSINKKHSDRTVAICDGESFVAGGGVQTTAGFYLDTLRTALNCDSIVSTHLIVNPKPVPDLGLDRDLCVGTQVLISPGVFDKYLWQDQTTSDSLRVTAAGVYWVRVTNLLNCSATDSFVVRTLLPLPNNFLKPTDSVCQYEKIEIRVLKTYSDYLWSTGSIDSKLVIEAPGQYWLKVTDARGCKGIDTITILPKECMYGVYIPTAFTPNKDGKNDLFRALVYGKVQSFKLQVFDRAGQLVFQTTNPDKGWNGLNKGFAYSTMVFVWQCFYQLEGQQLEHQSGTVTLIR